MGKPREISNANQVKHVALEKKNKSRTDFC